MTADTPADRAATERLREHAERIIRISEQARFYSPAVRVFDLDHIELARDAIAALEEVASLLSELADLRKYNERVEDER